MNQQHLSEHTEQITRILQHLLLLGRHLSLYSEDNAVVRDATTRLQRDLTGAHLAGYSFQVTVAKDTFLILDQPLARKNQLFSKYAYRMYRHGITSLTLTEDVTVDALYGFLRLIHGSPTTTWDAGGIVARIAAQQLDGILVTEMSSNDFLFVDADPLDKEAFTPSAGTDFWERYARSLLTAAAGTDTEDADIAAVDPAQLAERISVLLSGKSPRQNTFNRAIIRGILTVQGQYPKSQRIDILLKLAELINHLDEDASQAVLREIGRQQIPGDYVEEFFQHLSNKVILGAFRQVTSQSTTSSPLLISLIGKLATSRKLVSQEEISAWRAEQVNLSGNTLELLRAKDLDKYVPPHYQTMLMDVLTNEQLPQPVDSELATLQKSLDYFNVEQQMSRLTVYLLQNEPDQQLLAALNQQIIRSLQFHLDTADYSGLLHLCRSSFSGRSAVEILALTKRLPRTFIVQLLEDVPRLDKDQQALIGAIVELIGTPAIDQLLVLTANEHNRSVRFFYLSCLKKLGPEVVDRAVPYLTEHPWYVTRNMLLLLGEYGARDQLHHIRPLLQHSHAKVRQEALKTCLMLDDRVSVKQITANLSSTNRLEVLNAVVLCTLIDNRETIRLLIRMLEKESLFRFDLELKKALVQTLAESGKPEALKSFARILNRHSLFRGRALEQLKIDIVKALVRYPRKQVFALLQEQARRGDGELAGQARQALERLEQEKTP
ncbi:MAG: hypothetical protein R6W66_11740 [Pelovirga sp.]